MQVDPQASGPAKPHPARAAARRGVALVRPLALAVLAVVLLIVVGLGPRLARASVDVATATDGSVVLRATYARAPAAGPPDEFAMRFGLLPTLPLNVKAAGVTGTVPAWALPPVVVVPPPRPQPRRVPDPDGPVDLRALPPAYREMIVAAAHEHHVPASLMAAVIAAESGFDARAVSRRGAAGLMQLMPDTARRFKVHNRFSPQQNIRGGAAYLKWLDQRFNGQLDLVLAAYNAGENAVARHGRVPGYRETRRYVAKVKRHLDRFQAVEADGRQASAGAPVAAVATVN